MIRSEEAAGGGQRIGRVGAIEFPAGRDEVILQRHGAIAGSREVARGVQSVAGNRY